MGRKTAVLGFTCLSLCGAGARMEAAAQGVVEHISVYAETAQAKASVAAPPRSAMPLVSPQLLPRESLLRVQSGASVASPRGAASGSANGEAAGDAPSVKPFAFGTGSELAIAPYTTARASATRLGATPLVPSAVGVTSYPWRATGKLSFKIDGEDYVCTASMIKPGLLVTAAHCVFEYGRGSKGWHTNFVFAPAQYANGKPPAYGYWHSLSEFVPTPYINGTDTCLTRGVVCNNDIAVLAMARDRAGRLPGTVVGWYGYGWGGYSSVLSFGGAVLSSITQLGYPVAFDSGLMLERNDGVGALWLSGSLRNTLLGTAFTGGSSGGPWMVNFGTVPEVDTTRASLGISSIANVVVGVTSWGYTTVGANTQGASFFGPNREYPNSSYKDRRGVDRGAGNIGFLVMTACNLRPERC